LSYILVVELYSKAVYKSTTHWKERGQFSFSIHGLAINIYCILWENRIKRTIILTEFLWMAVKLEMNIKAFG
jgi:hypothetical protein